MQFHLVEMIVREPSHRDIKDRLKEIFEKSFGVQFATDASNIDLPSQTAALQKVAAYFPDDLSREILLDVAVKTMKGEKTPELKEQMKAVITKVAPCRKADMTAIAKRLGEQNATEKTIPKRLGDEKFVLPFYKRGNVTLCEVTTEDGNQLMPRVVVAISTDAEYNRVKRNKDQMDTTIKSNTKSTTPTVLKVHAPKEIVKTLSSNEAKNTIKTGF